MAVLPEQVNTRKIALVAEYGVDPQDVSADGFTDDYFTVVARWPHFDRLGIRTEAMYASNEQPRLRVYWLGADRARAAEAIAGDYAESIGPDGTREIAALRDQVSSTVPIV